MEISAGIGYLALTEVSGLPRAPVALVAQFAADLQSKKATHLTSMLCLSGA